MIEDSMEPPHRTQNENRKEDQIELAERLAVIERRTLPLVTATVRRLVDWEIDELAELPEAASARQDRFDEYESRLAAVEAHLERLGDVTSEQTTKERKIAAVLAYADNKRDTGQTTIAVTAPEIKGCIGVSRRYAYDLLEEIATEVASCRLREATTVETSTGTKQKSKAVLVDCETAHRDGAGGNSFTTGTSQEVACAASERTSEGDQ